MRVVYAFAIAGVLLGEVALGDAAPGTRAGTPRWVVEAIETGRAAPQRP
jgi:hypothetical protein